MVLTSGLRDSRKKRMKDEKIWREKETGKERPKSKWHLPQLIIESWEVATGWRVTGKAPKSKGCNGSHDTEAPRSPDLAQFLLGDQSHGMQEL